MFVVMTGVHRVPMPVMQVVDVVAVRNGDVPAPLAMHMIVILVRCVLRGFAFVVMIGVRTVQMSIMDIVDMVAVRDRDMPAPLTMRMIVAGVFLVRSRHHAHLVLTIDPITSAAIGQKDATRTGNGASQWISFVRSDPLGREILSVHCGRSLISQRWHAGSSSPA